MWWFESVYRFEMPEMHLQNFEKLYNKNAFRLSEKPPYFFTPTLAWDIHILLITLPKISSDGFSEK